MGSLLPALAAGGRLVFRSFRFDQASHHARRHGTAAARSDRVSANARCDLPQRRTLRVSAHRDGGDGVVRSEEHTAELQSLMRISYDVCCLKTKKRTE